MEARWVELTLRTVQGLGSSMGIAEGTDEARLSAYEQLRQMLSWLRLPLADPGPAGY